MFASPSQMAYQLGVQFPKCVLLEIPDHAQVQKPSSTRYYQQTIFR